VGRGSSPRRVGVLKILPGVGFEGRPLARWVRAVGSAGTARSGLDGWIEALPGALAASLARVPGYVIAETTTAAMALSFCPSPLAAPPNVG